MIFPHRTIKPLVAPSIALTIASAGLLPACQPAPPPSGRLPPSAYGYSPGASAASELVSEAARSGFRRTGRYDEVERLCPAFERAYPQQVRCVKFGTTPEGRPMLAIVASSDGVLSPEQARAQHRPVILFQGGIHAGEIDGKDGGFWALQDLIGDMRPLKALQKATAVFVPVLNIDGHERFGPNQRPNQRGPEEMGFRVTAQNLNLNRDYVKVEAPETRAMLGLLDAWDPIVYVDLHTTDGAKFEHDVAVLVEPSVPVPGDLQAPAQALSNAIQTRLTAKGHLPVSFYPSFRKNDDPTSGFSHAAPPPRFSQAYAALRNRMGILVETHSWRPHVQRVTSVHDFLLALFDQASTDGAGWRKTADDADVAATRLAGTRVAMTYKPNETSHMIEFRGYAYQKRPSEISGGTWISYDESKPEIWRVPLFDSAEPALTVDAPGAGYVIPAAHAEWLGAKLRTHGLQYQVMHAPRPRFSVGAFRADEVSYGNSFEGRTPVTVKGAWKTEARDIPKGSLFVPIAQPRARLLMHLLEPLAPDSLVAWGFFNGAFERKEYMEEYVAEEEARKMLAANPALRTEFDARLKDPKFAGDPKARLDFFYRRHPSWDERVNLIPIYRVAASPM